MTPTFTDVTDAIHRILTALPHPHDLPGQRCERCQKWLAVFQVAAERRCVGEAVAPYYKRLCAECLTPRERFEIDEGRRVAEMERLSARDLVDYAGNI
jgi:hypothetical protein